MKASKLLHGRSEAFKLDAQHLTRDMDQFVKDWRDNGGIIVDNGEPDSRDYRAMRDRAIGYRVASLELANLADELSRAGQ